MATLHQLRIQWTGAKGMPGVSTFYCTGDKDAVLANLHTFFVGCRGSIPSSVRIIFPAAGVDIDTTSGQPVGSWSTIQQADVVGTGTGTYAAPVGCVVNWHTGLFVGGRELRGKTFIVPLVSAAFATDGTLDETIRSAIESAANTLRSAPDSIRIWGKSTGADAPVTGAKVPDLGAVLRSRR